MLVEKLGLASNRKRMVYMGGISELNMVCEAIEAVAHVPQLDFLIAGWCAPEYQRKIETLLAKLGLKTRVFLVGFQPDRWDFLANGDIGYCVYSEFELRTRYVTTASNKMMEAIAAGLAVLIGPQTGSQEFLAQFPVGVCLKDFRIESFTEALQRLVTNDEALAQMKKSGPEAHQKVLHYEKQFAPALAAFQQTWERIA